MHRLTAVGATVAVVSTVAYVVAIEVAFPGRALSVTGLMVGLALAGVGVSRDG